MPDATGDVTLLLRRLNAGEKDVDAKLFAIVYNQLRSLAARYMRVERPGHTLQPTALVHEAFAALIGGQPIEIKDRGHFMVMAARAMRRILVDHARARGAQKREHQKVPLEDIDPGSPEKVVETLAVHEALEQLADEDPLLTKIVELRYFAGLSVEETAEALAISTRGVKRKWAVARVRLFERLQGQFA